MVRPSGAVRRSADAEAKMTSGGARTNVVEVQDPYDGDNDDWRCPMEPSSECESEGEDEKTGVKAYCGTFSESHSETTRKNVPHVVREIQPAMSWTPTGGAPGMGAIFNDERGDASGG